MTEDELRAAIREKASGGKVTCKTLLDVAAATGTPPREIGRLCDELKVKIVACQLGCFR